MESDFIKQKGAIDLLFSLKESPKTFNDLVRVMRLGPNTVLARLREAQKEGLAEEALVRKENGRASIKYTLTKEGEKVIASFSSVKENYEKLKKELDELKNSEKEKEARITQLLSSKSSTNTKISVSRNKISKSKNVNIKIENEE